MNRTILSAVLCVALDGCASTRPASESALGAPVEIEATRVANPPAPMRVVEVPTPLPLPGQLKPLPEAQAPASGDPAHVVAAANRAARIEPARDGFIDAMQVWPYSDGALRSEEHTSELQPLMRHAYAVFCWKKKKHQLYRTLCLKYLH